ncbi:hypothetical protein KY285_015002 [Solanum tuberosum]|nr:hypothetical protein KY284_023362 [Solanum tuberosum]KAH0718971.1 hypothetical protein KY285_015002 [Solanum tuberosum]
MERNEPIMASEWYKQFRPVQLTNKGPVGRTQRPGQAIGKRAPDHPTQQKRRDGFLAGLRCSQKAQSSKAETNRSGIRPGIRPFRSLPTKQLHPRICMLGEPHDPSVWKGRAGRPLTWAGEGLGSLFFRTLVRNKARRPPAGFEMDQVGHPFTTWVELAVFSIFFNAHNGSTPSHFFFYDLIYLKCLPVSAEKVPRGPNERALKGLQLKLRQYLKDSKDLLDEFPYDSDRLYFISCMISGLAVSCLKATVSLFLREDFLPRLPMKNLKSIGKGCGASPAGPALTCPQTASPHQAAGIAKCSATKQAFPNTAEVAKEVGGRRKKQIGQRPSLSVRSSRSSSPTKPTTPLSSPDTRQSKYPPPCRSQSSDGNHTAAAALRARLLCLSLTYALAACPLRAIRCNTRSS